MKNLPDSTSYCYALFQMWRRSCYTVFQIPLTSLCLKKKCCAAYMVSDCCSTNSQGEKFLKHVRRDWFLLQECKHSCRGKPDPESTTSCHRRLEQVFMGLPPQIFTMCKIVLVMISISHPKLYTAPFNLKKHKITLKLWPRPAIALRARLASSSAARIYTRYPFPTRRSLPFQQQFNTYKQVKGQARNGKWGKTKLRCN